MNQTEKNSAKRDRQRSNRIQREVQEMALDYGRNFIRDMDEETREELKSMPHPKRPDLDYLSAYSYIEWMCVEKGWHKKAKALVEELTNNEVAA